MENGRKHPTWQWLTGILVVLVLSIAGWAWCDTRAIIKENQIKLEQKVDKTQYDKDITRVMKSLEVIQDDIKDLLRRNK